jgi:spore germination protein GerM
MTYMKKFIIITALVMVLILTLMGCQSPVKSIDQGEPKKSGDTIVNPEPQGETVELSLYFANQEYIQTGNDSLDKLLVEKRQVTVTDKGLAEVAVEELMKGPKGKEMSAVIPSRIQLINVEVADNIAYVNFSGSGMNGGSLEETMLINSVVMTLTELDNIQAVQFLVDGKKTESLMGHAYTMEPINRNDI